VACGQSVCGFGFGVVVGGELEDRGRGGDLWFGWLEDGIPPGIPGAVGLTDITPAGIVAGQPQLLTFRNLGAECLVLRGQVTNPGRRLSELL